VNTTDLETTPLWPFVVYFAAATALLTVMLALSYFLGQRHRDQATGEPFESGIVSTGSARMRFDAKFYLMAMFFVIFDLETAFIFAWAIAVPELGWTGYVEILVFIGILLAALSYLWRLGALDWGTVKHRGSRPTPVHGAAARSHVGQGGKRRES
jgi:NADH-quinone oxidoreductase subunit A